MSVSVSVSADAVVVGVGRQGVGVNALMGAIIAEHGRVRDNTCRASKPHTPRLESLPTTVPAASESIVYSTNSTYEDPMSTKQ